MSQREDRNERIEKYVNVNDVTNMMLFRILYCVASLSI